MDGQPLFNPYTAHEWLPRDHVIRIRRRLERYEGGSPNWYDEVNMSQLEDARRLLEFAELVSDLCDKLGIKSFEELEEKLTASRSARDFQILNREHERALEVAASKQKLIDGFSSELTTLSRQLQEAQACLSKVSGGLFDLKRQAVDEGR